MNASSESGGVQTAPTKQAPIGQLLWWLLMCGNGFVACVLLYFFMVGMVDGTVSAFNALHWLLLWGALLGPVAGGVALRRRGRVWLGVLLLAIPALPGALIGFFALMFFLGGANWQ